MSDVSSILSLPFIQPAQAQKHVTHNEALRLLDLLVQPVVADRSLTLPPALPVEGERHIVAAGGLGAWAGHDGEIALLVDGGWQFVAPQPGWQAHVLAEATSVTYDGAAWVAPAETALQVAELGVGATPDATNRLSVAAPATLLSHVGAGHQLKLNKATPGDTASLLFQTGFSGRAEMGLAGGDDFAIKISADGTAWNTGLTLDAATGKVMLPLGAVVTGPITGTAVTQTATDTTAGRLLKVGDFGLGANAVTAVTDYDALTVTGFYRNGAVATGTPIAATLYWSLLHIAHASDGTAASQLALRSAGTAKNDMWLRRKSGGAWQPWAKVFHSENLLGTVSQVSGVPTGAVIERGANANGEYVKFADGTLRCTLSAVNMAYLTADLVTFTWTFPAPCIVGSFPVVSATLSSVPADYTGLSRRDLCAFGQSTGTSGAVLSFTRPSGATRAFIAGDAAANVRLVVNGRWF